MPPARGVRYGGTAAPSLASRTDGEGGIREVRPVGTEILRPGEVLVHELSGGGGYGDPLDREPALVADDVLAGFVTAERAREMCAVVVRRNEETRLPEHDEAATRDLRATRGHQRNTPTT
ncbi:hypothetical protein ACIQPP_48100 [Streptomyces violaceusniger]|uniref:hypothetical protein n=1 Tax=Streptomyces violaceusniger TaxID=68280 RepID=UPI00131E539A|nr:hypothetical protein [Streptomyces hygroscopicus]